MTKLFLDLKQMKLNTLKIYVFSVFFIFPVLLNAQSVEELLSKADQYKASDPEKFQHIVQQVENNTIDLTEAQSQFLDYLKTFSLITEGNYQDSISRLEEIQDKTNVPKVKVRSLLSLSNIYAFTKQYEKAFTSLNFVTDNMPKISDPELLNVVYLAMANTYLLTNQYQLSQKYAELLLDQIEDDVLRCRANHYLYSSILNQKEFQSLDYKKIEEIKALCVETKQSVVAYFLEIAMIRAHIENVETQLKETDWRQFKEGLTVILADSQGVHLKSLELTIQSLLAKTSFMLGELEAAETLAQAVINSKEVMGDNQPKLDAMEVLKNIAEQKGDYQLAYGYLSELEAIKDELMADNQLKELAFLNVKHASLARELEIEQLNKSNKILKIEQQLAQQNAYNQQLLVLLLLIVLGIVVVWLFQISKRHGALVKVAHLDHLTKVYNRSGFEKKVKEWIKLAEQSQSELHFAIIDFDHFKQINDQYGHLTGDWVLKHVIYEIKKHLNEQVMLARLGGEEFALVYLNQSAQMADGEMERIRGIIANLDLTASGHDIAVTCSFGVTSAQVSGYNLVSLLTHADVALYQAKSAGRNKVIRYQA